MFPFALLNPLIHAYQSYLLISQNTHFPMGLQTYNDNVTTVSYARFEPDKRYFQELSNDLLSRVVDIRG